MEEAGPRSRRRGLVSSSRIRSGMLRTRSQMVAYAGAARRLDALLKHSSKKIILIVTAKKTTKIDWVCFEIK